MRKLTTLATGLALTGAVASAHAVDVKLYGQVNKALVSFNDGENTDFAIVDNDIGDTRFGFKGEQKLDNGLTASVMYEVEMQSNPSNLFTQNNTAGQSATPTSNTPSLDERLASVGLAGDFGGVVLGQLATATNNVFTQDLTGAQDVMTADARKFGGGLNLRTTAGALSGVTINSMTYDGSPKRADAIRYDSPKFNGLQAKASLAQGGDAEIAGFYEGTLADIKLKGALGVEFNNDTASTTANSVETRYAAAISALHSSGIGATVGYTTDELKNRTATSNEPDQWYAKVGYAWGNYEVAADYGVADNYGAPTLAKSELTAMGLAAQYNMGNGVSVAGLYRNFSGERTGADYQDVDLFAANLRVKF